MSDAALLLARRFPGGIESLAPRLGKSAHSLRHELTGSGTAKLGLKDAETMSMLAVADRVENPLAILNEMALNCRALVLPLPEHARGDVTTFQDLATAAREFGDFMSSVADAAADGEVTANELARVDREFGQLMGCAQALRTRLAQIHKAGMPAGRSSDA